MQVGTFRSKTVVRLGSVLMFLVFQASLVMAQTAPQIFFTDLISGPTSNATPALGGENNKGVYVTIYGVNFGLSQGTSTVTVGGGAVDHCPVWGATWLWYQKITCQLGANAKSGNIIVTVNSQSSNGVPFTVRAGRIFFLSTTGKDTNNGSFTSPWATIAHAKGQEQAGDTFYLMNGYVQTAASGQFGQAVLELDTPGGTSASPIAYLAYPGATATLGSSSNGINAINVPNVDNTGSHYVFGSLKLIGDGQCGSAIGLGSLGQTKTNKNNDFRIIGDEMTAPNITGGPCSAAFHAQVTDFTYLYGNYVHNTNAPSNITKGNHNVYYTTDSNHIWIGWNEINGADGNACRGILIHSSPTGTNGSDGFEQFDIHIFNNYIHDTHCDGVNIDTIDPSKGPIEVYGNVFVHDGTGILVGEQSGFTCIFGNFGNDITNGTSGSGDAEIYNNTFYDCGSANTSTFGGVGNDEISKNINFHLRNNIFYLKSTEPYIADGQTQIYGDTNVFFGGNGAAPTTGFSTGFANNITTDPKFTNPSTAANAVGAGNFELLSGSPAIDRGLSIPTLTMDLVGVPRPQGTKLDLGALEFPQGTVKPNPPSNVQVVIH